MMAENVKKRKATQLLPSVSTVELTVAIICASETSAEANKASYAMTVINLTRIREDGTTHHNRNGCTLVCSGVQSQLYHIWKCI